MANFTTVMDVQQAANQTQVFSGLYNLTIQFQAPAGTFGPSGAPTGNFTNVAGLVDRFTGASAIGCMDAPLSDGTISSLEAKSLIEIESDGMRHVSLNGYYAAVVQNWQSPNANMNWRAVIGGIFYEVFAVETDSERTQTRVKLRNIQV